MVADGRKCCFTNWSFGTNHSAKGVAVIKMNMLKNESLENHLTAERFFALYEKVRERYNLRARNHLRIQLEAVSCEVERLARDIQNLTDSQSAAVNEYAAKALESAVKLKMLSDELGSTNHQ